MSTWAIIDAGAFKFAGPSNLIHRPRPDQSRHTTLVVARCGANGRSGEHPEARQVHWASGYVEPVEYCPTCWPQGGPPDDPSQQGGMTMPDDEHDLLVLEWADASDLPTRLIAPGEITDAHGHTNDTPAIVVGRVVVELGSPETWPTTVKTLRMLANDIQFIYDNSKEAT